MFWTLRLTQQSSILTHSVFLEYCQEHRTVISFISTVRFIRFVAAISMNGKDLEIFLTGLVAVQTLVVVPSLRLSHLS